MTITNRLRTAYRFFFEAGYVVGHRAECARALVRAEQHATDNDWAAEWVADDDRDLSWMTEDERQQPHEVLGCVLRDADSNVLASLWGITDPDSSYQRVVEAELAAEALHNEHQLNRVCAE